MRGGFRHRTDFHRVRSGLLHPTEQSAGRQQNLQLVHSIALARPNWWFRCHSARLCGSGLGGCDREYLHGLPARRATKDTGGILKMDRIDCQGNVRQSTGHCCLPDSAITDCFTIAEAALLDVKYVSHTTATRDRRTGRNRNAAGMT